MTDRNAPKASEATLSTGDLARRIGTTVRTVRFYEEAGMLMPTAVGKGGRRLYTELDLERLALITDLRELDLSLDEIKGLLDMREGCADAPQLAERFSQALGEQLERAQRRLAALERLGAEFAAAIEVLGACRACETPLKTRPCGRCEVISRDETPRIMKIVVGNVGDDPAAS